MKPLFTISLLISNIICFSQTKLQLLADKVMEADSIWIIHYSMYDSLSGVRKSVKQNKLDSIFPSSITKLERKEKFELGCIIQKEKNFTGRIAYTKPFNPEQAIMLWNNNKYIYFELCIPCHFIALPDKDHFTWMIIDPSKAEYLQGFFNNVRMLSKSK